MSTQQCHECGKKEAEIETELGQHCLECARKELEYWQDQYEGHVADMETAEDEADSAKEKVDELELAIEKREAETDPHELKARAAAAHEKALGVFEEAQENLDCTLDACEDGTQEIADAQNKLKDASVYEIKARADYIAALRKVRKAEE